ncbi:hypothetical protein [Pseudomonas guariconensis]|uniref:hypothetical protein n=1 Tax=Pseudomonas guariconensis TaxID=1288410 RepID=UPI002B0592DD|nr:hypothetical protein [Pseudomonas guariconensis]
MIMRSALRSTSLETSEFRMNGRVPTPKFSLEPGVNRKLCAWENITARGLGLVHAVTLEKYNMGDFSRMRAADAFRHWDVFSTSLISVNGKPSRKVKPGWGKQIAGGVGFLLEVPPQNILGAFRKDVWFPTHANATSYELASRIFSGEGKCGYKVKGGYKQIALPEALVNVGNPFNEVLVVGRPGVNVHFAQTEEVRVAGIVYSQHSLYASESWYDDWTLIIKLQRLNPDLEVIFV